MSFFNELVRNIIICVILFSIVDVLIISKTLKKYIALFCGFVLIMVIFSTGKKYVNKIINIIDIGSEKSLMSTFNTSKKKIKKINKNINENDEKYIEDFIKNKYDKLKFLRINIVRNYDKIEKIKIRCKEIEDKYLNEENKKEIIDKLCEYFNVAEECIEIRVIK